MRVGVIGTGFGRRVVAPAFAGTDGCHVVDIVTPRDDKAVSRLCRRSDNLLPGLLAATRTGLTPAGRHELVDMDHLNFTTSSRIWLVPTSAGHTNIGRGTESWRR